MQLNGVTAHTAENPLHKKNPDVGLKLTTYSPSLFLEHEDGSDLSVGEEVCIAFSAIYNVSRLLSWIGGMQSSRV